MFNVFPHTHNVICTQQAYCTSTPCFSLCAGPHIELFTIYLISIYSLSIWLVVVILILCVEWQTCEDVPPVSVSTLHVEPWYTPLTSTLTSRLVYRSTNYLLYWLIIIISIFYYLLPFPVGNSITIVEDYLSHHNHDNETLVTICVEQETVLCQLYAMNPASRSSPSIEHFNDINELSHIGLLWFYRQSSCQSHTYTTWAKRLKFSTFSI